jgi:hypothetical protein
VSHVAVAAFVATQVCYSIIHNAVVSAKPFVSGFSAGVWLLCTLWPVAALCIGDLVKRVDITRHRLLMRRLRLHFDTRLGMYSPR